MSSIALGAAVAFTVANGASPSPHLAPSDTTLLPALVIDVSDIVFVCLPEDGTQLFDLGPDSAAAFIDR